MLDFDTKLKLNYQQLTPEAAPHLFAAIDDLTQKAAHPDARFDEVYMVKPEHVLEKKLEHSHIGVNSKNGKNMLFFGQDAADVFGFKAPHSPVSEELKAVVAHELGHLRFGHAKPTGKTAIANATPLIGALAGVAGTALAHQLITKHPHDQAAQSNELEK